MREQEMSAVLLRENGFVVYEGRRWRPLRVTTDQHTGKKSVVLEGFGGTLTIKVPLEEVQATREG